MNPIQPLDQTSKITEPELGQKVNYLNRCVENISTETERHQKLLKTFHLSLAIGAGVIAVAAAITAIVVTVVFFPTSLPLTSMCLMCAAPIAIHFIQANLNRANLIDQKLQMQKTIRELNTNFSTEDLFYKKIEELKIPKESACPTLSPILAHYQYWHDLMIKSQSISKNFKDLYKEHLRDFPKEKQITETLDVSHLAYHDFSLICKIQASFYRGLLSREGLSFPVEQMICFGNTIDSKIVPLSYTNKEELKKFIQGDIGALSSNRFDQDWALIGKISREKTSILTLHKIQQEYTRKQLGRISEQNLAELVFSTR